MKLFSSFLIAVLSFLFTTPLAMANTHDRIVKKLNHSRHSVKLIDSTPSAVNINKADAQTIAVAIKGIGPRRAQAIVQYRAEHGSFQSLDDLVKVRGISKRFIAKNKDALIQRVSF